MGVRVKRSVVVCAGGAVLVSVLAGCFGPAEADGSPSGSPGVSATPSSTPGQIVPAPQPPAEGITYSVEGDFAEAISVSYATVESGEYRIQEVTPATLPWTMTLTGVAPDAFGEQGMTVIAQSPAGGSKVTCRVTYEGRVLVENSADGPYGVAICNAPSNGQ